MKATFFGGTFPQEAEQARQALENANINFREPFSRDEGRPLLIVEGNSFSYKGLAEIQSYCNAQPQSN